MSSITNIEKIPEEIRSLVETGLLAALKKGSMGQAKINFVQIETSLSGGKTGAAVLVARYGIQVKKGKGRKEEAGATFIRVLKIAPKEVCQSENEGYVKTKEKLLDIFSQVEYYPEDEFELRGGYGTASAAETKYGILLYQDVGTVAASDLKGIAKYFTNKIKKISANTIESEKFSRELSLLMQKEVFLGLKKGLYGNL